MSRVQFVETVTAPGGVNGALIPLVGVGATPYVVNPDGTEGGQANAYAGRIGATAASSMITDISGTVSYWLDAGDYDVHIDDQQSPPRIASYIRGFTAPVIDTNQIIVGAQNLIQFTGDTKFSMQTADHGLKSDGSFEWLLITNASDGGGRQVDGTIYAVLRQLLGNPPLTLGKFRLPNISGRALIAAGAASGLSVRHLLDLFGTETEALDITKVPSHDHGGVTSTGTLPARTIASTPSGSDHRHGGPNGNTLYFDFLGQGLNVAIVSGSGPFAAGVGTGNFGVPTNNNTPWRMGSTGNADANHTHDTTIPAYTVPALGIAPAGNGSAPIHNNIGPSAGMNLFVKT